MDKIEALDIPKIPWWMRAIISGLVAFAIFGWVTAEDAQHILDYGNAYCLEDEAVVRTLAGWSPSGRNEFVTDHHPNIGCVPLDNIRIYPLGDNQ